MEPEDRVSLVRGEDDSERKAIEDIRNYGIHIIHVFDPDDENPRFSYTVGLWHTHRHPEILIFGLKLELCQSVLNSLNTDISNGQSFNTGTSSRDVLKSFRCYFESLPKPQFREYLGWDLWFYGSDEFETVQMLWPNTAGVFPWDDQADDELRWIEPILTNRPLIVS